MITSFPLQTKALDIILGIHISNLDNWLSSKGLSFGSEWTKYNKNEYSINYNIRAHFENLTLTYGKKMVDAWLQTNVKQSA